MNNEREFVDDNESKIAEDEAVLWHGMYSKRDRTTAWLGIVLSVAIVTGFLISFFGDLTVGIIVAAIIFGLVCVPLLQNYRKGVCENHIIVTNKKLKAYVKLVYWFGYQDIIKCKLTKNPFDLLFNTGTVTVRVVHTWASAGTREVTRRAVGDLVIRDLKNPEEFVRALMKAKKDSGL